MLYITQYREIYIKEEIYLKQVNFAVKPLNQIGQYYGFTLDTSPKFQSPFGAILHNSGKSVLEQSIVGHVSRFPDHFQLAGVNQFAHSF